MQFDKDIRDLALNFYWQKIYSSAKEINGIHLFENTSGFSGFQVMFIYWLEIYYSLYKDLALHEYENLSENVIKDHRRCDAFLYWRQRDNEKKLNEANQESKKTTRMTKAGAKGKHKSYRIYTGATKDGA